MFVHMLNRIHTCRKHTATAVAVQDFATGTLFTGVLIKGGRDLARGTCLTCPISQISKRFVQHITIVAHLMIMSMSATIFEAIWRIVLAVGDIWACLAWSTESSHAQQHHLQKPRHQKQLRIWDGPFNTVQPVDS